MEEDAVNECKRICGEFFSKQGLIVHFDIAISDAIRWRPHVFATNGSKILLDIFDEEKVPEFYIKKFIQARNAVPGLKIYLGIIGQSNYLFEFVSECARNGFGIYVIDSALKLLLEAREPTVEELAQNGQLAIAYGQPFGNILSFKKCLRSCKSHVWWLERNLPKKVLETLYEAVKDCDISEINNIRLLRVVDDDLDDGFKDEFSKFKDEMAQKGILAEFRIIADPIGKFVHGRYIYSKDEKNTDLRFQLPPLNSLKANQWDTILTDVKVVPPFEELWKKALDLLTDWGEVKNKVKEHLKNKALLLETEVKRLKARAG